MKAVLVTVSLIIVYWFTLPKNMEDLKQQGARDRPATQIPLDTFFPCA
jgi:hypothetical protein